MSRLAAANYVPTTALMVCACTRSLVDAIEFWLSWSHVRNFVFAGGAMTMLGIFPLIFSLHYSNTVAQATLTYVISTG